jgi:hypothetical protein
VKNEEAAMKFLDHIKEIDNLIDQRKEAEYRFQAA